MVQRRNTRSRARERHRRARTMSVGRQRGVRREYRERRTASADSVRLPVWERSPASQRLLRIENPEVGTPTPRRPRRRTALYNLPRPTGGPIRDTRSEERRVTQTTQRPRRRSAVYERPMPYQSPRRDTHSE